MADLHASIHSADSAATGTVPQHTIVHIHNVPQPMQFLKSVVSNHQQPRRVSLFRLLLHEFTYAAQNLCRQSTSDHCFIGPNAYHTSTQHNLVTSRWQSVGMASLPTQTGSERVTMQLNRMFANLNKNYLSKKNRIKNEQMILQRQTIDWSVCLHLRGFLWLWPLNPWS